VTTPSDPITVGLRAYSHSDLPKDYILPTAKGIMAKTVTIDEIPKNELNEWGFPASPMWAFRGFTNGASRYERVGGDAR